MSVSRFLGRAAYVMLLPALRTYGATLGKYRVRVAVVSEKGTLLLVKTWLGKQRWSLPGGGISRGETPMRAAVRGLKEETGILAHTTDLALLGERKGDQAIPFHLTIFLLRVPEESLRPLDFPYSGEIIDRKWVKLDELPQDRSPIIDWVMSRPELHHTT